MDPRELLTSNLALIERAVAFACRRYRFNPDDAEEFGAVVKLRLVENDYAVLRAYEERSSFRTFISIVVQRMALDYRIHEWGKFHSSAEAKRLGPLAVRLEQLLHRDGRTFDEAAAVLASSDVTRESLQQLAARLPARPPRHRDVEIDEAMELPSAPAALDERIVAEERQRVSDRVSTALSAAIARLPEQDRLILQLRFEGGMSVAQIARALRIDQKLLYRRIDHHKLELRRELERSGLAAGDVLDLIGEEGIDFTFRLGNPQSRPSMSIDESRGAADSEVSS